MPQRPRPEFASFLKPGDNLIFAQVPCDFFANILGFAELQSGVLYGLHNLLIGICLPQIIIEKNKFLRRTAQFPVPFKRTADADPAVAGSRWDKNGFERRTVKNFLVGYAIQCNASSQAQVIKSRLFVDTIAQVNKRIFKFCLHLICQTGKFLKSVIPLIFG
ncbi:hypothetical protein D3C75_879760 [compost metagenome]